MKRKNWDENNLSFFAFFFQKSIVKMSPICIIY